MIRAVTLAACLIISFLSEANAQTFDGVYRGTRTITSAQWPGCPGIGGPTTSIEFHVSGATITLRYLLQSGTVFRGKFSPDGTFRISTPYATGGGTAYVNWSGRIDGGRINGTLVGIGSDRECRGTMTAQKRR